MEIKEQEIQKYSREYSLVNDINVADRYIVQKAFQEGFKKSISISEPKEGNEKDSELLDWLQEVLTPKNDYCEVFFAGLRASVDSDAGSFQIESNPEKFATLHGRSVREAILFAMKQYKSNNCENS